MRVIAFSGGIDMQHGKHRAPTRPRTARRGAVLVLSLVLGLALGLSAADADPGQGQDEPGAAGTDQPGDQPGQADEDGEQPGAVVEPEEPVGSPGTIAANADYGYAWPLAPDCDESTVSTSGCVNDGRGFFQGQCTSWVAHRLSQLNGISFTNWYRGRHWGDADQWAAVAKSLEIKPDDQPSAGDVAWYARGHVAYVESVNPDGSIVISEMNFDGHNGFRMITLYPGSSWPDKFIHLADMVPGASTVVPVDTTAPTAPSGLRVVSHHGRIGVDWRPSSDEWGVTGYRVSRSGASLASTPAGSTSYWDHQVSPGQSYSYSVVAYDDAGNVSAPATVDVGHPAEAADRAWVSTAAGPALCGRTGELAGQRLGCSVLTPRGWRFNGLGRDTRWGRPGTRSIVSSTDGGVTYCRNVGDGEPRRGVACTSLDPDTMAWGYDRIAGSIDRTLEEDRTWVSTRQGPALCGLTGSAARQRVGCTVLTDAGWRFAGIGRHTSWGEPGSRAFLATDDGGVSFCRRVKGAGNRQLASCTPFDPEALIWGYDRISRSPEPTLDTNRTWLVTGAGPALCGRAGADHDQRLGCSVLSDAGWDYQRLGRSTPWGTPVSRAFVPAGRYGVSYCRTLHGPAGDRAACTRFDALRGKWGTDRIARATERTHQDNRSWHETGAGPALCGRSGSEANQRLACNVLTGRGWHRAAQSAAWGDNGTFVASAEGRLSYCRSLTPPGRPARLACTALEASGRAWGPNRISDAARLTLADPF